MAAYEDEAPTLQALDRALFGGSPDEVPELYRERSPITYVDAVRAPLLILAGENDSRCPIRQIWNYVGRLRERGHRARASTPTRPATPRSTSRSGSGRRRSCSTTSPSTVPGTRRLEGIEAHVEAAGATVGAGLAIRRPLAAARISRARVPSESSRCRPAGGGALMPRSRVRVAAAIVALAAWAVIAGGALAADQDVTISGFAFGPGSRDGERGRHA